MTFEELWKQVNGLPDTAMIQVPAVLSPATKKKLMQKNPEEIGRVISAVIDEINRGSVETVDALVRKRL